MRRRTRGGGAATIFIRPTRRQILDGSLKLEVTLPGHGADLASRRYSQAMISAPGSGAATSCYKESRQKRLVSTLGRKLRVLAVVDTFSRLLPALDARFSYRAEVVATLERVCARTG